MHKLALFFIAAYRTAISPLKPACCRYIPTCSDYAQHALNQHGMLRGGWLALRRLSRCHPFGGSGLDEVPPRRHTQKDAQ